MLGIIRQQGFFFFFFSLESVQGIQLSFLIAIFFLTVSTCLWVDYLLSFTFTANKVLHLKRKVGVDSTSSSVSRKAPKLSHPTISKKDKCKQLAARKVKPAKPKIANPFPRSDGCARTSIDGWEWHRWSHNASPAVRARARGAHFVHNQYLGSEFSSSQCSNAKGLSARTNRVKLRNLLAAAEGAELLKSTQLKVTQA